MKIIDAFWEKRNLGVSSVELVISEADSVDDIKVIQSEIADIDYVVAKVPPGRFDIITLLHEMGFIFIEASLSQVHDLKNIELTGIFGRLNKQITHEKMQKQDITQLFIEMKKDMFETDRIYIDPYFTREQAANRYICWIKDELDKGSELFNVIYRDNKIGFFAFKELDKNIYYPFLASLYNEYKATGMGFSVVQKPLEEAKNRNGKMMSTYVSSNNMPIFKIHTELGFKTNRINYVLVRHKRLNSKSELKFV